MATARIDPGNHPCRQAFIRPPLRLSVSADDVGARPMPLESSARGGGHRSRLAQPQGGNVLMVCGGARGGPCKGIRQRFYSSYQSLPIVETPAQKGAEKSAWSSG